MIVNSFGTQHTHVGEDSTGKQVFHVEGSRFLINRRLHQNVQGESNYSLAFDCNSEANGTHGEMEGHKTFVF